MLAQRQGFLLAFCTLSMTWCAGAQSQIPKTDQQFHELALSASERQNKDKDFSLPHGAYVIGVEKANSSQVGSVPECDGKISERCLKIDSSYFSDKEGLRNRIRRLYANQPRPMFISHVARFPGAAGGDPCFIYNIYVKAAPCVRAVTAIPKKRNFVSEGWQVMDLVKQHLAADMQSKDSPTHVLVYIMGWNTPQWEAMKNYRDLFGNVVAAGAGRADFRPLFIGITWSSTGSPTIPGSDFAIKAKDADEVGLMWGNVLVNRVLAELKGQAKFKVVVIGHSFGARASSRAALSAPLVADQPQKTVDLLIGLQSAYSFQRYVLGAGIEDSPYRDFSKFIGKSVLTASRFDTAVTRAGHEEYFAGSAAAFEKSKGFPIFDHTATRVDGTTGITTCDGSKVLMVDASNVINKNQPGTGGGAHSYIYTPEIGKFTFELIQRCAF